MNNTEPETSFIDKTDKFDYNGIIIDTFESEEYLVDKRTGKITKITFSTPIDARKTGER